MTEIVLTSHEVRLVAMAGVERRISALGAGRVHKYGLGHSDYWTMDIEAAGAEYAVARALDRHWLAVADDPATLLGDVGLVQVRHTTRENGSLILHPDDADEAPFILVVGSIPRYRVVGGIRGRDGKKQEWWRTDTGRPAFFVPQRALSPIKQRAAA